MLKSDDNSSDEEEDEEKKEEEKKDSGKEDKAQSGSGSKGTNTPSGKKPEGSKKSKSLKRAGSPALSESSGNESSRKKLKKNVTSAAGSRSGTPLPQGAAARRALGAGSGSDGEATAGEMSDGAMSKRKKLKIVSHSARGTPSASRAGSPNPTQGGKFLLDLVRIRTITNHILQLPLLALLAAQVSSRPKFWTRFPTRASPSANLSSSLTTALVTKRRARCLRQNGFNW